MIERLQIRSLAVKKAYGSEKSVLISSGGRDEDLFYQAPLGAPQGPCDFLIYFHETSRLLERVRLLGAIDITAQFSDGRTFAGALKVARDIPEQNAAVLQLHEEMVQEDRNNPHLIPHT